MTPKPQANTLGEMNVQIHFKENGIPSIHAGKLTDESKAKIQALITEATVEQENKNRTRLAWQITHLKPHTKSGLRIAFDESHDRLTQLKEKL